MGLRKRPEAAFESLYSRHVRDVYGYALGVLGSSADAEDVTQTTFLNAYRALQDGKRPRTPRSWLFAIAHNVCRQRFRQAARRPREVELHDAYAVEEDTDAPSAHDIARALQSLPFTQRSALVMRELEGRSQAEIADALGVSVSAVETLLFRARRGMREQLESSLTCGEAARAISRQLDGASSRAERGALRAHLRVCEECATFARKARARSGAMRRVGGALPLPASLLSWTIGGGGAASGLGVKALAGTAALVLAAGATEQVVVHRDPPPHRAATARVAPPVVTKRAVVTEPVLVPRPATPGGQHHRVADTKSDGHQGAAHGQAKRHARRSQRAGTPSGAEWSRGRAVGRRAGSSSPRGAGSSRGSWSPRSAGSQRVSTPPRRAVTQRQQATSRHAASPRGARKGAPRGRKP